jgi:hypothetical protein
VQISGTSSPKGVVEFADARGISDGDEWHFNIHPMKAEVE